MTDARLQSVRTQAYTLPLAVPWRTARGALTRRDGWIVHVQDADGNAGLGECAPLPAAGTETAAQARTTLEAWRHRLSGVTPVEALDALGPMTGTPAARCAIECALLDLITRRAGLPLRCRLGDNPQPSIPVNAYVGSADPALAARCAAAVAAGFKVLKIKLGVHAPDAERHALQRAVRPMPPGVSLRLDANGAWDLRAARGWLTWLADMPIESLEEPLSSIDLGSLQDLQRQAPFPLAMDESALAMLELPGADAWPVRRLVLKPMVHGGALATLAVARRFLAAGVEVVFTTALEAAPGRWLCAHVAAAAGPSPAHGLDTGRWLAEDLGEGPVVAEGACRLGNREGLGIVLA